MARPTHKVILTALAGLALATAVALVLSTVVRTNGAIQEAAPPDPAGSGAIGSWAGGDTAAHARDDMHGLASAVGPSPEPPRYARRIDGIVFQTGRILAGDTLVAGVFEPAERAGGNVGAFRVAAMDLQTGRPVWRSPPSFTVLVPLRAADGAVTVLAGPRHRESEPRRLAIGTAAARMSGRPLDPVTYVLRSLLTAMEDAHGTQKRIIRLVGAGEEREVEVDAHTAGVSWSEDLFVSAGTTDVAITSLAKLETRTVEGCLYSAQMADVSVRPGLLFTSWRERAHPPDAFQEATTPEPRPATAGAAGAVRLGVTAVDTSAGKVLWHTEWAFPSITLVSDAGSAPAEDGVVLHISEGATAVAGSMMAYAAATGRPLWRRPVSSPAGQDLFGDPAFSRRTEHGGAVSWWFCTVTRRSSLATDSAAQTGLFLVDIARGTGRFLSRRALGLSATDALRVLWSGDELMVLQAGDKPQLLLVAPNGSVRWRVSLPSPLEEKRLGLVANDRWIVAGNLVLER